MPFGHGFFDYKLSEGTLHKGDLILVPFRNKKIPALVAKISTSSDFEDRAISLSNPKKILKLPESVVEFCLNASRESFVSPSTMLNAWLRTVPKRLEAYEPHVPKKDVHKLKNQKKSEQYFAINRYMGEKGIIEIARTEQISGRVLIVTPWQKRVDFLQNKIGCQGFHSQTAAGAAWRIWTSFLNESHGVLVTSRLGSWLAAIADVVIIDEPENDDHKQDELTPRYDSRRLIEIASEINPALRVIQISTTPALKEFKNTNFNNPDLTIDLDIKTASFNRHTRSYIESLTMQATEEMEQSALENRPIRVLHPVHGTRGRVRCADCDWMLTCPSCGAGVNADGAQAVCHRCLKKMDMPALCPVCQGMNLSKSVIGQSSLKQICLKAFPNIKLEVLDLHEWLANPISPNSTIIISNLAFIAGFAEDIRKKERLVLAFRRLMSQACVAKCRVVVQASEELALECKNWLNSEGLQKTWEIEWNERNIFGYPPAKKLIKLILPGELKDAEELKTKFSNLTENTNNFNFQGPFPVEFRPKSRAPRSVFHIFPSSELSRDQIIDNLAPFTAFGILDIDPIAFFC